MRSASTTVESRCAIMMHVRCRCADSRVTARNAAKICASVTVSTALVASSHSSTGASLRRARLHAVHGVAVGAALRKGGAASRRAATGRAPNSDTLLLAARQLEPSLSHERLVARRHPRDGLMQASKPRRVLNLLARTARPPVPAISGRDPIQGAWQKGEGWWIPAARHPRLSAIESLKRTTSCGMTPMEREGRVRL